MNQEEIKEQIRIILRDTYASGVDSVGIANSAYEEYDYDIKVDQILSLLENYEP